MSIPLTDIDIPFIDTEQMIEVDRAMINDYQISLIQMMENAGRTLAILTRERFLQGNARARSIIVMAGTGGNGGGALVAARRLHNWGAHVSVYLANPAAKMTPVPLQQLDILKRMGIPCTVGPAEPAPDAPPTVIIDGLIGYSLRGNPYGTTKELIKWANSQTTPILALDTPSGIDTTTGTIFDPVVSATATMTLALPKQGLRQPEAAKYVGELYLADISVPPSLYQSPPLNLDVGPVFANSELVRLKGFNHEAS